MKNILVTGSSGLVGSSLINRLEKLGITCIPFDIRANEAQNIQYLEALYATEEVDGIVHLAGTSRVVLGQRNPELCRLNNVLGTRNVIKKAFFQKKKPWIIFASSREVYGQQESLPVHESFSRRPMNVYAKSKHLAENLIFEAAQQGLKASVIRLSNVFGGLTDHANRVIPAFCLAALSNNPLRLEGADNVFDFTYIEDVIDGIVKLIHLLNTSSDLPPPIHFVSNRGISLSEAASIIIDKAQGGQVVKTTPRDYDVSKFYGDNSRARSLLDWSPKYTFEESISRFINDLKTHPFNAVIVR